MKIQKNTFRNLIIILIIGITSCTPETKYDICIYSGNSAGVISAVSAVRMGKKVVVIEPGEHLGGLSAGGLGETDIGNKHVIIGIARDFYRKIGKHYNKFESWKFEPHVAEEVFENYIKEGRIEVIRNYRVIEVSKKEQQIEEVTFESSKGEGENIKIKSKFFIDCSYEGDLMAKAGVDYFVGREDNSVYGETINGVQLRENHQIKDPIDPYKIEGDSTSGLLWGINSEALKPNGTGDKKVQAYNYRMCWTDSVENQKPFSETKPKNYDPDRYALLLRMMQERDKTWKQHDAYIYFIFNIMPNNKTDINNMGGFSSDYVGGNWEYPEADYAKREEIIQDHINYTKGLLYFLATDERVPERIQKSINKWGWAKDEFSGDIPHQLYVREARRMIGEYVMTEHNCWGDSTVEDGIALAAYTMDSHNCDRVVVKKDGKSVVKAEGNVEVGGFSPYPIAFRSLLPKKTQCTNLFVPVAMSASHIAYGSIRMEPVFMVLGQISAVAASLAIDAGSISHDVDYKEINKIMETNPLLDGSYPDILVDNSDKENIVIEGNWLDTNRWMGQYKSDYYISTDKGSVRFIPEIKETGEYYVYIFSPRQPKKRDFDTWTDSLKVEIKTNENKTTLYLNEGKVIKDWLEAGVYNFSSNGENYIELFSESSEKISAADAVLLVRKQ